MSKNSRDDLVKSETWPRELLVASVHGAAHLLIAQPFADHVLAEVHGDRLRCATCGHEVRLLDVHGCEAQAERDAPRRRGTAGPVAAALPALL